MRREIVADIYAGVSADLFEDVRYTPAGGAASVVTQAIFGIMPVDTRFDGFSGGQMRTATHTTRALLAKFPALARGDVFRDGTAPDFADGADYKVIDFQRPADGDGRFEIEIGFQKL
jgi:hypothetical protein